MSVAVIGLGPVGQGQVKMFAGRGFTVVGYDIRDGKYPEREIGRCDFAVICVGTPAQPDGGANLTGLLDAFLRLPDDLPTLIRSTVPPGTTDSLARMRPQRKVCHAPEFMHERSRAQWRSPADVPWMLLGGTAEARAFFRRYLEKVFPHPIHEYSAVETEVAKYASNLYWAVKVTFVNEMARAAAAFGADWAHVREAWLADKRVCPSYTSMAGFEPGFAGRCWPKDLTAFIQACSEAGYKPEFLEAVEEANARFRE